MPGTPDEEDLDEVLNAARAMGQAAAALSDPALAELHPLMENTIDLAAGIAERDDT